MLTQSRLHEVLSYDPENGSWVWKKLPNRLATNIFVGKTAGCISVSGYRVIVLDGGIYPAHRLAWLYVHGEFPDGDIDHKNRIRSDNRIQNLRVVTHKQNMENKSISSNNKSGHPGVFWDKVRKKWKAKLGHLRQHIHLGYFVSLEDAVKARKSAEVKYFTPID
jgi:hypothetical protein